MYLNIWPSVVQTSVAGHYSPPSASHSDSKQIEDGETGNFYSNS